MNYWYAVFIGIHSKKPVALFENRGTAENYARLKFGGMGIVDKVELGDVFGVLEGNKGK